MKIVELFWHCDDLSRERTKLPLIDLLTLCCFYLLVVIHCVENTSLIYKDLPWMMYMYNIRNMICIVLMAKAALASVYRPIELWTILLMLAAGALCMRFSNDFTMLEFAIVVVAAKDLPHRKLLHGFAVIKTVAVIATIALTMVNIIPNIIYANGSDGVYYTYGFCHRNVLGANIAVLCMAWLYLHYNDLRRRDLILWCCLTVVSYFFAYSRTSLLIMVMAIGATMICHYFGGTILTFRHTRVTLAVFFLGLFVVCIVCTIFYERHSNFWEIIDQFFTKRLQFASQCLDDYGFSLFGQQIDFVSTQQAQAPIITSQSGMSLAAAFQHAVTMFKNFWKLAADHLSKVLALLGSSSSGGIGGYFSSLHSQFDYDTDRLILDNAYMRAVIYNGIIPGCLFIAIYYAALNHIWSRKNLPLVAGMMVMAIYGISERFMLDVYYNFPLMLACIAMFHQPEYQTGDAYWFPLEYIWHILRLILTSPKKLFDHLREKN